MQIQDKELLNLPVYTELNEFVGHVIGFDIDTEQHVITHYVVGKHKLVENILQPILQPVLGSNPLRVASSQVRSITDEKMIIADTAIPAERHEVAERNLSSGQPVASSPLASSLDASLNGSFNTSLEESN